MYTRNLLWLVSLVSAAPLYAADVSPPTHRSPRNKSFVTTIIATQARSTRKR